MAKRQRRRQRTARGEQPASGGSRHEPPPHEPQVARAEPLRAPDSDYSDPNGNLLTLRGSFKPAARAEYARTLSGTGAGASARAATTQEDSWQRAVELLFERLAVRWVIAGAPIERQRELLARFRVASAAERAWVREVLREHCAEHFPDIKTP